MKHIKKLITTSLIFLSGTHFANPLNKELQHSGHSIFIENNAGEQNIIQQFEGYYTIDNDTVRILIEQAKKNNNKKMEKNIIDLMQGKKLCYKKLITKNESYKKQAEAIKYIIKLTK